MLAASFWHNQHTGLMFICNFQPNLPNQPGWHCDRLGSQKQSTILSGFAGILQSDKHARVGLECAIHSQGQDHARALIAVQASQCHALIL